MSIHPPQQQQRDPRLAMRLEGARLPRRSLAVVLPAALTAVLALGGCSGGGGTEDAAEPRDEAPPEVTADVRVAVGTVNVESAGPPAEIPPAVVDQVTDLVRTYVQRATIDPLTGKDADGVAELFTPFTAATLEGPDGASLVDEGLGRATRDITANTATVNLDGLADGAGNLVLLAASVALDLETATEDGPLRISRLGELVLVPDGFEWKIDSYDLAVERDTPAGDLAPDGSTEVSS